MITLEVFSPYTAWYFVVPDARLTVDGRREQEWLHRRNHRETLFLTRRDKGKAESYTSSDQHSNPKLEYQSAPGKRGNR